MISDRSGTLQQARIRNLRGKTDHDDILWVGNFAYARMSFRPQHLHHLPSPRRRPHHRSMASGLELLQK